MPMIITTSWDDGHPLDLRLAELLSGYGIRGTFYVPHHDEHRATMSESEVRDLSTGFEIGGHTYSHVVLTGLSPTHRRREIEDGKHYLSDVTGRECRSFAFPSGRYTRAVLDQVVTSGYAFARTVALFRTSIPDVRRRLMHTTVQVHDHTWATYVRHCLKRGYVSSMVRNHLFLGAATPLDLVRRYLAGIEASGHGVLHLWGHSWEIDEHDMWKALDQICRTLSGRSGFAYLTNLEAWEACQASTLSGAPGDGNVLRP